MNDRDNPSHEEIRKRIEELSARIDSLQGEISKTRDDLIGLRILLAQPSEPPTETSPAPPPISPPKPPPTQPPPEPFWAESPFYPGPKTEAPKPVERKEKIGKPISPELGTGYANYDHLFDEPSPGPEPRAAEGAKAEAPEHALPLPRFTTPAKDSDAEEMDLETKIGAVWFNRIGLVILVIGVSLMARVAHPHLEAWHKVALSYLFAFALFGVGKFFEERLKTFARPVMAGGMSIAFFTSFAGHFVEAMQCLALWPSLLLMSASVGWIVLMAERWKSEPTAGLAIFLGHVAAFTAAGSANVFSLAAILFLAVAGCALFLRHDWAPLNLFAVLASFVSHMLWAVQDHPPSTPQIQFWVNFGFLTSYYTIFTFSDVVFRKRVFESGLGRYTPIQVRAARAVGPAALVLYATLAAFFFKATGIYWEQIHWFWLPLAAVQAALAWLHREKQNPDYPVYGTAATIFFTLGLASALGGFSLNLALAAEALMLLVLAQRLRLWFLNPLAQIVLAINFLHYWNSEAHEVETWPVFFGSLATASVYFVKSRIEERWTSGIRDEGMIESAFVSVIRELSDAVMRPLSYAHAIGGSALVVYQCNRFLEGFHAPVAISIFAGVLILAALFFRSVPFVPASWAVSAGTALSIILKWPDAEPDGAFLFGTVLAALLIVAASTAALEASRLLRSRLFLVLGFGGTAIGTIAFLIACLQPVASVPLFVWTLSVPLLLWIGVDRERNGIGGEHGLAFRSPLERWSLPLTPHLVCGALSIGAGVTLSAAVGQHLEPIQWKILFLSTAVLGLLAVAILRDAPPFGIGLFILLASGFVLDHPLGVLGDEEGGMGWMWWNATSALLVSVGAFAGAMLLGRASFAWLGFGALALLEWQMVERIRWWTGTEMATVHYALWILTTFGLWGAIEVFRETFYTKDRGAYSGWTDRVGIEPLTKFAPYLAGAASVVAAFLLYRFSVGFFDHKTDAAWAVGVYAMLLFAGAGMLGSFSMGVGGVTALTLAHACVYLFNGAAYVGTHHPFLMTFLTLLPLAVGGALEFSVWREKRYIPERRFNQTIAVSVYLYAIAFLLARHLVEGQVGPRFDLSTAVFPVGLLFGLLVLVPAWRFGVSWLQISALAYSLAASVGFILRILDRLQLESGAFISAALMGVLLIGMERLLQRQPREILDRVRPGLSAVVHAALPPIAAVLTIVAARFSEELRMSWMTFTYSLVGAFFMGLGFWWRDRVYRRTALAVFILCIVRVVLIDIMNLELFHRMLAFICLGLCLLAVSWLYTRFQKQIHEWI